MADSLDRVVRRADHATGASSAIVGAGTSGFSGDGGLPLAATFNRFHGAAVDASRRTPSVKAVQSQDLRFVVRHV